jgi:DNA-binding MarR family transcriptional regulator
MMSHFTSFVDRHSEREAFLGNRLQRLVELIVEQGEALLCERGLSIRSTAASTLLLLAEKSDLSAADIARELQQPHQLVTQRVDALIDIGLVERRSDPRDGRRSVLAMTRKGRNEADILRVCLRDADQAFAAIFEEIGVNVSESADALAGALRRESLSARAATRKRVKKEVQ